MTLLRLDASFVIPPPILRPPRALHPNPARILPRILMPKLGNRPSIFRSSTRVTNILHRPGAKYSRASMCHQHPRRVSPTSSTARALTLPEPPLDLHDLHLDLVNTVTPCTLALVDVPRCQSPQLVARPSGPSVQAQHSSFAAPGPSARTRPTFTFATDHHLRLPYLRTARQETRCTT